MWPVIKVYINLIDQKEPIFQFNKDTKKCDYTNWNNWLFKKNYKHYREEKIHTEFLKSELKKNFY